MTSEDDCIEIRQQTVRAFCHSLAEIVGIFGGYSDILHMIARKDMTFDDQYVSDLIQRIRSSQQVTESRLTATLSTLNAQSDKCESVLGDISDQANTMYETGYHTWYNILAEIETRYLTSKEIDEQLTQQLLFHAQQLTSFRQFMLEQINRK